MSDLKVSELLEGATPGPWAYRPNECDDWGTVRAGRYVICQARNPSVPFEALGDYRRNGTDPYEANARLIASAPRLAREHASLTLEVAQLKQRVAGTIALALRNHEAGDWRMLKENLVSLGFAAEHGRYPDCNEIVAAFAALKESIPHVR